MPTRTDTITVPRDLLSRLTEAATKVGERLNEYDCTARETEELADAILRVGINAITTPAVLFCDHRHPVSPMLNYSGMGHANASHPMPADKSLTFRPKPDYAIPGVINIKSTDIPTSIRYAPALKTGDKVEAIPNVPPCAGPEIAGAIAADFAMRQNHPHLLASDDDDD